MSRNQLYCSWRVYLWTVERRRRRRKREKIHIDIHIVGPRIQTEHTHEVRIYLFFLHSLVVMSTVRFLLFLGKIYCSSFNPPTPIFPLHAFIALFCGFPIAEYCDLVSSTRRKRKMKVVDGEVYAIHEEVQENMRRQKWLLYHDMVYSWKKIAWRRTTKLEFFFFLFRSFARHTARTHTNVHEKFKRLKRIGCTVFSFFVRV